MAHQPGTLPGVAAKAGKPAALATLQRFKQRQGPFLLLADSTATALSLARHLSPTLRKKARQSWPGPVTLVFPGKPGLASACYKKSEIAVRVDNHASVLRLAHACGGLLLSSSLNRRGEASAAPGFRHHMRHHRYFRGRIASTEESGAASKVIRVWRNQCSIIRE